MSYINGLLKNPENLSDYFTGQQIMLFT